jgi:predicted negative regulator of RcsB-dependent stress response
MSDIYDNYEQSERVRNWLRENGGAIVLGIVVAIAAVYGVRYWNNNLQNKRIAAATEYQSLGIALEAGNLDAAVEHFETLKARHKSSRYIGLSALYMAQARLEGGQYELAGKNLRLAMEQDPAGPVSIIARQRLARLMLDQGQADEALALLDTAGEITGFESRYAEVRGDILASQGDTDAAVLAYQSALDTMAAGTGNRELIELKIDNLAVISAPQPEPES